jgi:phosphate transport system substrate-binding protein
MVSRPLVGTERNLFNFALCRDGAAIIVHRTNTIKNVTSRQLADILSGPSTDWKQLGRPPGGDQGRMAHAGSGDSGAPASQQLRLTTKQVRSHAIYPLTAEAVKFVASEPDGITIAALGIGDRSIKAGGAIKMLAYEGITPSTRTVRDRTYPLSRPLLLVTRTVPTGWHQRLVDYAVSPAVNDLVEKHRLRPVPGVSVSAPHPGRLGRLRLEERSKAHGLPPGIMLLHAMRAHLETWAWKNR